MGSSQPPLTELDDSSGHLPLPSSFPWVGVLSHPDGALPCPRPGRPVGPPQARSPQHQLGAASSLRRSTAALAWLAPPRPGSISARLTQTLSSNHTSEQAVARPHPHFFWFLLM